MHNNNDLEKITAAKVLVIGDIMLDRYINGAVSRISPEAPVPVVKAESTSETLGGAANVINNICGLGASCSIIGVVGNDVHKEALVKMFDALGISPILFETENCTATKVRVVGGRQQITRIDFEDFLPAQHKVFKELEREVASNIGNYDVVVISDYGKGLISDEFCKYIISTAKKAGKRVIVDPKGSDWGKYTGADIVTPNVKELGEVFGSAVLNNDDDVTSAAREVQRRYNVGTLVVTRSEKGVSIVGSDEALHIPTEAQEVFDVSGAGDTVIATIACGLGAGLPLDAAVRIANLAAGIVVSKVGTAPIKYSELVHAVHKRVTATMDIDTVAELVKSYKGDGKKVVFTNGCFDILHRGHIAYLEQAKKLGDILILGLNSDASVRRLKGSARPINNEEDRAFVLAALRCIDYVVIFGEDTPVELLKRILPDVIVKGGDYTVEQVIGREYAKEVAIIDFVDGYSTTKTIERMK